MDIPKSVIDKVRQLPASVTSVVISRNKTGPDGRSFWTVKAEIWDNCTASPDDLWINSLIDAGTKKE